MYVHVCVGEDVDACMWRLGSTSGVILSLSPLHYNYMDTRVSVCRHTQMNIGVVGGHQIPLELELGWL